MLKICPVTKSAVSVFPGEAYPYRLKEVQVWQKVSLCLIEPLGGRLANDVLGQLCYILVCYIHKVVQGGVVAQVFQVHTKTFDEDLFKKKKLDFGYISEWMSLKQWHSTYNTHTIFNIVTDLGTRTISTILNKAICSAYFLIGRICVSASVFSRERGPFCASTDDMLSVSEPACARRFFNVSLCPARSLTQSQSTTWELLWFCVCFSMPFQWLWAVLFSPTQSLSFPKP